MDAVNWLGAGGALSDILSRPTPALIQAVLHVKAQGNALEMRNIADRKPR